MHMIINFHLNRVVFAGFNPHLTSEESKIIGNVYAEIRNAGPPQLFFSIYLYSYLR